MIKLAVLNFSVLCVDVTDRLLSSMKVNSAVYCRGCLLLITYLIVSLAEAHEGGARFISSALCRLA